MLSSVAPKFNHFNLMSKNMVVFGIGLAVLSNILFAVLYMYSNWLSPLSGTQVFLWRMVAMWFGLAFIMLMTNGFAKLISFLQTLKSKKDIAFLVLPTPILASQLWLFMWAPLNGHAVNVAIGYFLFPLMMVLVGRLVFAERLNRLKTLAITLAGLGVLFQIWLAGSVSWTTAWVCLTYPIYYALRRWQNVPALLGLFIDLSIIAPITLAILLWQGTTLSMVFGSSSMMLLIAGLGLISALAMQSNLTASNLLPVNLFGMLSYLEPALMFLLSIFILKEVVSVEQLFSFGLIWAGIVVMIINAMKEGKKPI